VICIAFSFKVLKDRNEFQPDFSAQIGLLLSTAKDILFNYQLVIRAFCLSFLAILAISLGLICLIFPGIWLAVSFTLSNYILVEHYEELPSSIVDSLRLSKNIVNKNWCNWFLLLIVLSLLYLLIVPIPVTYLVLAIAVRETVGLKPEM